MAGIFSPTVNTPSGVGEGWGGEGRGGVAPGFNMQVREGIFYVMVTLFI